MSAPLPSTGRMPGSRLRVFSTFFLKRRKAILLSLTWGIVISLVIIKSHFLFYLTNQKFSVYRISWLSYNGPEFTDLDLALLFFSSLIIGVLATDAKRMIYGYFAAILTSTSIAVLYVFLYNWLILRLGETLNVISFGWETGIYIAFLNVIRFMFPMGMVCCLIGSIVGYIAAIWIRF